MSEQLSPNSKPRFQWIDQAKGIAILTILVFHFFQNYPDATPLIKTLTDKIAAKLGFAAVDIFFIIAGFNIGYSLLKPAAVSLSYLDWLSWLKKRLIRLYPGYFLAIFFTLVLSFLGGQFKIKSGFNFILSLLGIAGYQFQAINPGFWFFTVILEAYLITPLIFWMTQKQLNRIFILGILLGLTGKIICLFIGSEKSSLFWFFLSNNFIISYAFQFCLGLYWGKKYAQGIFPEKTDVVASIFVFLTGVAIYFITLFRGIDTLYMLGFDLLFSPASFIGIYYFIHALPDRGIGMSSIKKIFLILGLFSYQIYLIHQPFYLVIFPILRRNIQLSLPLEILVYMLVMFSLLPAYMYCFVKLESYLNRLMFRPKLTNPG